jgi:hypothetical protein
VRIGDAEVLGQPLSPRRWRHSVMPHGPPRSVGPTSAGIVRPRLGNPDKNGAFLGSQSSYQQRNDQEDDVVNPESTCTCNPTLIW